MPSGEVRTADPDEDLPAGVRSFVDVNLPDLVPRSEDRGATLDVVGLARIALRWWYVTIIGLTATAAIALLVVRTTPSEYEVVAPFLVTSLQSDLEGANRSINRDSLAASIATTLSMRSGARFDEESYQGPAFQVVADELDGVLEVVAVGDTLEQAEELVRRVVTDAVNLVEERQADLGIPVEDRVVARPLNERATDATDAEGAGGTPVPPDSTARATGSLFLEAPLSSTSNPYSSWTFTYRVLEEIIESSNYRDRIREGSSDYTFTRNSRDTAPIFYMNVHGTDEDDTRSTFENLVRASDEVLSARQSAAGVHGSKRISLEPLVEFDEPAEMAGDLKRPLAAVIGVGGVLTLLACVLLDRWRRHRVHLGPRRV